MPRRAAIVACALALGGYGLVCGHAFRQRSAVEPPPPAGGAWSRAAGPAAAELERAAVLHLDRALAQLNDPGRTPAERLRMHREELLAAEDLLVATLTRQPARPRALARLAAVRWELDPGNARPLGAIEAASALAPAAVDVQRQLGELLLAMGRTDDAVSFLRRSAEIDPAASDEAIRSLRGGGLDAEQILAALPADPRVLARMANVFLDEDAAPAYLREVERRLASDPGSAIPELLAAYGKACLVAGDAPRLRERMSALGVLEDADADAQRLKQRSRAWLAMRDARSALADARQARDRRPDDYEFAAHLGGALEAADDADGAVRAFGDALALLAARGTDSPRARAGIYSRIGRIEERRGQTMPAYLAYRRALDLDPQQPWAVRRIGELERAAGVNAR